MKSVRLFVLCLGAALLLQAGCGPSSDAKLKNDLKTTGLAWHMYHDDNKKGPANWDEFITYAKGANLGADSILRVRDAKCDLKWDAKLSDVKDGLANTLLAEKPGGGLKIMMDGSVR